MLRTRGRFKSNGYRGQVDLRRTWYLCLCRSQILPAGDELEQPSEAPTPASKVGQIASGGLKRFILEERNEGHFPPVRGRNARVNVAGHINGSAPKPTGWAKSGICPDPLDSFTLKEGVSAQFSKSQPGVRKIGQKPFGGLESASSTMRILIDNPQGNLEVESSFDDGSSLEEIGYV